MAIFPKWLKNKQKITRKPSPDGCTSTSIEIWNAAESCALRVSCCNTAGRQNDTHPVDTTNTMANTRYSSEQGTRDAYPRVRGFYLHMNDEADELIKRTANTLAFCSVWITKKTPKQSKRVYIMYVCEYFLITVCT